MARKIYRAAQEKTAPVSYDTSLPTDLPIAIYYRQSTEGQVGNISTTLQTVDMVKYLKQQGWAEEKIIMIDMDGGVSGATKIDERPGMRWLFSLITENKIGAVACQDEDRLFRDVTQIQVNVFIEACRSHSVKVITPTMMYHFDHEQMGTFHARQFRFRSEMAADYLNTVIRGKLMRARESIAMNGQWSGGPLPVGYMVDMRKTLPDGSRNELYRKYVPFEPYAMVVREYFRLHVEFAGNLGKILRHIHKHGPYFPDPATCPPPDGLRVHYKIKPNMHGWCPKSKPSLIHIFTNEAYIGHWVVNDVVVKWHNHPAIVDEATFYQVFNLRSPLNLDGSENQAFRELRFNERPSLEEERQEEHPLLAGLVFSWIDGEIRQVGTRWSKKGDISHYYYLLTKYDGYSTPVWSKTASYLDHTVIDLLLSKLKLTFDYDVWEVEVDASIEEVASDLKLKRSQMTQLATVMENLVASLSTLTTPQLIAAVEQKYQDAQREQERLHQEIQTLSSRIADIEGLKNLKGAYQTALADWDGLSHDEKRELIHAFIEKVEAQKIPGPSKLHLKVYWRDGSSSEINMARTHANGTIWLPQETDTLMQLVESGASQLEIAKTFPNLPWNKIYYKYHYVTKKSLDLRGDHPIEKYETYNEYVERVGKKTVTSEGDSPICSSCQFSRRFSLQGVPVSWSVWRVWNGWRRACWRSPTLFCGGR